MPSPSPSRWERTSTPRWPWSRTASTPPSLSCREASPRRAFTILKVSPNILLVASLYSEDDRYDETFFSNYAIINVQNPLARIQGGRPDPDIRSRPLQHAGLAGPEAPADLRDHDRRCPGGHPGAEHRGGGRADRRPAGPGEPALPVHDQRPGPALRCEPVRGDHDQVGPRPAAPRRSSCACATSAGWS